MRAHALLCVMVVALFFVAGIYDLVGNDIWWHLKTGEWIAAHHGVPRADPFSATAAGHPWIDHEWLFQLAAYAVDLVLGVPGIVLLQALACAAVAALLLLLLRGGGRTARAFGPAFLLLCLLPVRERAAARPETVSLVLFALLLLLLEGARRGAWKAVPLAFAVGAVWANVHAAVVLGTAVAAAYATGAWIQERIGRGREGSPHAGPIMATAVAFGVATLANPFGWRIYTVPFTLSTIVGKPWARNLEWIRPPVRDFPWLYLLAAVTAAVLAWMAAIQKRIDPSRLFAVAGTAVMALLQLRHMGFFAVAAPLVLLDDRACTVPARPAADAGGSARHRGASGRAGIAAFVAGVMLVGFFAARDGLHRPGLGVSSTVFPVREVDFMSRAGLRGPIFNEVGHGGYLIYKGIAPFIDGRNELYAGLLPEIHDALADTARFTALLDRFGVQMALVRYQPEKVNVEYEREGQVARGRRAFSAVYFHKSRWALVYWDDAAMVFVKRGGVNDNVIASNEYRAIQPEDWEFVLQKIARREIDASSVEDDVKRKLQERPACARARRLLSVFAVLDDKKRSSVTKSGSFDDQGDP